MNDFATVDLGVIDGRFDAYSRAVRMASDGLAGGMGVLAPPRGERFIVALDGGRLAGVAAWREDVGKMDVDSLYGGDESIAALRRRLGMLSEFLDLQQIIRVGGMSPNALEVIPANAVRIERHGEEHVIPVLPGPPGQCFNAS